MGVAVSGPGLEAVADASLGVIPTELTASEIADGENAFPSVGLTGSLELKERFRLCRDDDDDSRNSGSL